MRKLLKQWTAIVCTISLLLLYLMPVSAFSEEALDPIAEPAPVIEMTREEEEQPVVQNEEPAVEETVIEEPETEELIIEELIIEEPETEEPVIEEPVIEEPETKEPETIEQVTEEQVVEEHVTEMQVIEKQVTGKPEIKKPVVEELIIEESTDELEDAELVGETKEIEDYETALGLGLGETKEGTDDNVVILEMTDSDLISEEDLPENAMLLAKLPDELNESRMINIYFVSEGEEIHFGDTVQLYAVLKGFEDCEFTVQWQVSPDDVNYVDIENQNGLTYSFVVTEQNYTNYWRIVATITAVNIPDELL